MAFVDIGIDLGTATVIIYEAGKGIVLKEPSVVAVNAATGKTLSVGEEAFKMIGRTPDNIRAFHPLADGVISNYEMTEEMIKYFLQKVCRSSVLKPRVALCVPSGITGVESRAVVDAAVSAGARNVYLIEEPVAAAIGAGIDISIPSGVMVLDIGGGTSDVAVLSLSGIVTKKSIKVAGQKFDQAIIKYVRNTRGILIGEKTAENMKMEIGSVYMESEEDDKEMIAKGRDLSVGLPKKFAIRRSDLYPVLRELALQIIAAVQAVAEVTPPELVGDIFSGGILLTGGGAKLTGMTQLVEERTKIKAHLAQDPEDCVAKGTGMAFQMLDSLKDGFDAPPTHSH